MGAMDEFLAGAPKPELTDAQKRMKSITKTSRATAPEVTQAELTSRQQSAMDAFLSGVGKVGQGALVTGAAIEHHERVFSKAGRKKLQQEAQLTGSGVSELSQPFGLWQDVLGAGAKDVQRRGIMPVMADVLGVDPAHPTLGGNENLSALAHEVRDALNDNPKNWAKRLGKINAQHMIFNPQTLDDLRAGKPGAIQSIAGWLRDNPLGTMVASLGVEWWNPGGRIAGHAMQAAAPAVAKTLARAVPKDVRDSLGRKTNLYHDVMQSDTPPGLLDWRLQRGASEQQVKARYHDLRDQ